MNNDIQTAEAQIDRLVQSLNASYRDNKALRIALGVASEELTKAMGHAKDVECTLLEKQAQNQQLREEILNLQQMVREVS